MTRPGCGANGVFISPQKKASWAVSIFTIRRELLADGCQCGIAHQVGIGFQGEAQGILQVIHLSNSGKHVVAGLAEIIGNTLSKGFHGVALAHCGGYCLCRCGKVHPGKTSSRNRAFADGLALRLRLRRGYRSALTAFYAIKCSRLRKASNAVNFVRHLSWVRVASLVSFYLTQGRKVCKWNLRISLEKLLIVRVRGIPYVCGFIFRRGLFRAFASFGEQQKKHGHNHNQHDENQRAVAD